MDRIAIANETLEIISRGYYEKNGVRVDISAAQERSVKLSRFFSPEEGAALPLPPFVAEETRCLLRPQSAVRAVLDLAAASGKRIGVLNFASAKNPGGGFLNGAMAQEESLAASSGLYATLTANPEYYRRNRACGAMCYTHCAIYSPEVVFFRDERFTLLDRPVTASVLTLPAVNLGQVLQKGEDPARARQVMRERMALALRIFGAMGDRNLVLGAYGCGVFRNDPEEIARWWEELLEEPEWKGRFGSVTFAVLDSSREQNCYRAFGARFGPRERRKGSLVNQDGSE